MGTIRQERKNELEPSRLEFAKETFEKEGIKFVQLPQGKFEIEHKGETVVFWPYTGWHSGKSITDGRGIKNLIKQLKNG